MSTETIKSGDAGAPVLVTVSTERWSDFYLEDGTLIRVKVSISHAVKAPEPDAEGNPVYQINGVTTVVTIRRNAGSEVKS